ncbi:MAG: hypothetical protein RL131_967, partial [Bacteroidota bacterium]
MRSFLILCFSILLFVSQAQDKDQKLIIITTDGLRWQEVFKGMDSSIANTKRFNQNDSANIFKKYWDRSL